MTYPRSPSIVARPDSRNRHASRRACTTGPQPLAGVSANSSVSILSMSLRDFFRPKTLGPTLLNTRNSSSAKAAAIQNLPPAVAHTLKREITSRIFPRPGNYAVSGTGQRQSDYFRAIFIHPLAVHGDQASVKPERLAVAA